MPDTFLIEGDITAADTFTALTTRGSETTPSLQIPTSWTSIARLVAFVSYDQVAAGSAIFILRIGGKAVKPEQDIVIAGGGGAAVQAGSDAAPLITEAFTLEEAAIEVSGGDTIRIEAAMTDTDLGTARVVVLLYSG